MFNVKKGWEFINRNATPKDIIIFVQQRAITRHNPRKIKRRMGEGEAVEFDVVDGEEGREAVNVTGPDRKTVQGSPCTTDRRTF